MSSGFRTFVLWSYLVVTLITFLGIIAIVAFEAHVRWALNQNFSVLDANALAGLFVLLAAQMLGLAWLSRPH